MAKDTFLEWKEGREHSPKNSSVRTDGVDLWSYGLRIGARGIDGKLLALRPYGVSSQTDAHQHYATRVADRTVWGIQLPRDSWYERRGFVSDPAKVGTSVSYKISKSWSRETTALTHLDRMIAADKVGRAQYNHGHLVVQQDEHGKYAVFYFYAIAARDLAHSDWDGFDYTGLHLLLDTISA